MVVSKRERMIGIITGLVLAVLVLDQFVFEKLLDQRRDLEGQKAVASQTLHDKNVLIRTSNEDKPKWEQMRRDGLLSDSSRTETQIYNNLNAWAREAGLNPPPALKSDRTEKEKDFYKLTLRATGTGGMAQISRFLWHIQTANIPVKITELTISSRKEGADDLSLTMSVATAYLAPESETAPRNATASIGEVR
jgi:hypothetical protein